MSESITLRLTQEQASVLYEIINMTGVALHQIDADYGSVCIEALAAKALGIENRAASDAAHAIFNELDQVVGTKGGLS